MSRAPAVVVVGSGASGVHFAASLLEKGRRVRMLDVGLPRPEAVAPTLDIGGLKRELEDPRSYFLGRHFETVILPGHEDEYYGFPPNKSYVFDSRGSFEFAAKGFAPLVSFAAGGLAEAWTGGCYPFDDGDLADFPFAWAELEPFYSRVAERIGITGELDDMQRFFPGHRALEAPLDLDAHSARLVGSYERARSHLNEKLGCYLGRSRLAVLSRDRQDRKACSYLGRCLWGCPHDALYTPSVGLRECLRNPDFEYLSGLSVDHFRFDTAGRVRRVVAREVATQRLREFEVQQLALAAGTLCSSKILLKSIQLDSGERRELSGLMDNRQVLMPFVNLGLIGKSFETRSYQYHQLAFGLSGAEARDRVHGLVTTLKTALIHPVLQSIPASLGASLALFRNIHTALGLVNINFSDQRRSDNRLALELGSEGGDRLVIDYAPDALEPERIRHATRRLRRALLRLGCIAPPPMTHTRPMGSSVHYAGVVPMQEQGGELTADPLGRCRGFENLYLVDGITFPSLPAKNLTFTLMANASRIAEQAF